MTPVTFSSFSEVEISEDSVPAVCTFTSVLDQPVVTIRQAQVANSNLKI